MCCTSQSFFPHDTDTAGDQGAHIGVRSSALDLGVLNISCAFAFTGKDVGKTAQISARVQNTDCATCRGWTTLGDTNAGGYIGIMMGRDERTGDPFVKSFADFNRERYFSKLKSVPTTPRIAELFPIIDVFVPDGDLTSREEAFTAMYETMGINTPLGATPPDWTGRTSGIPWSAANQSFDAQGVLGIYWRKGSGAAYNNPSNSEPCYEPNSSCTLCCSMH